MVLPRTAIDTAPVVGEAIVTEPDPGLRPELRKSRAKVFPSRRAAMGTVGGLLACHRQGARLNRLRDVATHLGRRGLTFRAPIRACNGVRPAVRQRAEIRDSRGAPLATVALLVAVAILLAMGYSLPVAIGLLLGAVLGGVIGYVTVAQIRARPGRWFSMGAHSITDDRSSSEPGPEFHRFAQKGRDSRTRLSPGWSCSAHPAFLSMQESCDST